MLRLRKGRRRERSGRRRRSRRLLPRRLNCRPRSCARNTNLVAWLRRGYGGGRGPYYWSLRRRRRTRIVESAASIAAARGARGRQAGMHPVIEAGEGRAAGCNGGWNPAASWHPCWSSAAFYDCVLRFGRPARRDHLVVGDRRIRRRHDVAFQRRCAAAIAQSHPASRAYGGACETRVVLEPARTVSSG